MFDPVPHEWDMILSQICTLVLMLPHCTGSQEGPSAVMALPWITVSPIFLPPLEVLLPQMFREARAMGEVLVANMALHSVHGWHFENCRSEKDNLFHFFFATETLPVLTKTAQKLSLVQKLSLFRQVSVIFQWLLFGICIYIGKNERAMLSRPVTVHNMLNHAS